MVLSTPDFLTCSLWPVNTVIAEEPLLLCGALTSTNPGNARNGALRIGGVSAGQRRKALSLYLLRRLGARSRLQSWLPAPPSKITVARYSGAGKCWRQPRLGKRAAGAEAQRPGGKVRRPAELIECDAKQKRPEESGAKADAGIEPNRG